ncbi:hypothetical protein BIW11_06804 [Tropilaelaps mercedesae]|uniref:Uncharacterized protein n=1 Tax=Tropilaelaps mercedesae TaxID=418985 RepID=A0A1V9XWH0_9ACAR|nr:hypothetical protein BIW11_06804 [Tropilaelaps mercedesae]
MTARKKHPCDCPDLLRQAMQETLQSHTFYLMKAINNVAQMVVGLDTRVQMFEDRVTKQSAAVVNKFPSVEVDAPQTASISTQTTVAPWDAHRGRTFDASKPKVNQRVPMRSEEGAFKGAALEKTEAQTSGQTSSSEKSLEPIRGSMRFCDEGILYRKHETESSCCAVGHGCLITVAKAANMQHQIEIKVHYGNRGGRAFGKQIINSEMSSHVHQLSENSSLLCWTVEDNFSYAMHFAQLNAQELVRILADSNTRIVDKQPARCLLPFLPSLDWAPRRPDAQGNTDERSSLQTRTSDERRVLPLSSNYDNTAAAAAFCKRDLSWQVMSEEPSGVEGSSLMRPNEESRELQVEAAGPLRAPETLFTAQQAPRPMHRAYAEPRIYIRDRHPCNLRQRPFCVSTRAFNCSSSSSEFGQTNLSYDTEREKTLAEFAPAHGDSPVRSDASVFGQPWPTIGKTSKTPPVKTRAATNDVFSLFPRSYPTQKTSARTLTNVLPTASPHSKATPVPEQEDERSSSAYQTQKIHLQKGVSASINASLNDFDDPACSDESSASAGSTQNSARKSNVRRKISRNVATKIENSACTVGTLSLSGQAQKTALSSGGPVNNLAHTALEPSDGPGLAPSSVEAFKTTKRARTRTKQSPEAKQETLPEESSSAHTARLTAVSYNASNSTSNPGNVHRKQHTRYSEETPARNSQRTENTLVSENVEKTEQIFSKARVTLCCFTERQWCEVAKGTFAICGSPNKMRFVMVENTMHPKVYLNQAFNKGMSFKMSSDRKSLQWGPVNDARDHAEPHFFAVQFHSRRRCAAMINIIDTFKKNKATVGDSVQAPAFDLLNLPELSPKNRTMTSNSLQTPAFEPSNSSELLPTDVGSALVEVPQQESQLTQASVDEIESDQPKKLEKSVCFRSKLEELPPERNLAFTSKFRKRANGTTVKADKLNGQASADKTQQPSTLHLYSSSLLEGIALEGSENPRRPSIIHDALAASSSCTDKQNRTKVASPISLDRRMLSLDGELRVLDVKTGEWLHRGTGTIHFVLYKNGRTQIVMLDGENQVKCKHFIESGMHVRLLVGKVASWAALDFASGIAFPTLFRFEAKCRRDIESFRNVFEFVVKAKIGPESEEDPSNEPLSSKPIKTPVIRRSRIPAKRVLSEASGSAKSVTKYMWPSIEQVALLDCEARLFVYNLERGIWDELCDLDYFKISQLGATVYVSAEYRKPNPRTGLLACSHQIVADMRLHSRYGSNDDVSWHALDTLHDGIKQTAFTYVASSANERIAFKKAFRREELRLRQGQAGEPRRSTATSDRTAKSG